MNCIFCKIASGDIPSAKLFEDEKMLVIKDISPQAKLHFLIIPKQHFDDIADMSAKNSALLGEILAEFCRIAPELGLENGYRLVTNKGDDGRQSVKHLHIHALGGEKLSEIMG